MGRVFVQEGHNLAEVPPNAFPSLLAPAGSSQLAAWGSGIQMSAATEDSRIFPRHGFPAVPSVWTQQLSSYVEGGEGGVGDSEGNPSCSSVTFPASEFRERADFLGRLGCVVPSSWAKPWS